MANITQQYNNEEDPWFTSFFQFSTNCVKAKIAGNQTILLLFEDLFENCPEKSIQGLFPLFEKVINQGIALEMNELHLCTKICRTIMEKLTVTHDLHFRGILRKFLANTLPLSHQSGLNIRGEFNNNSTTLDPITSENSQKQEGRIYRNFWNLQ